MTYYSFAHLLIIYLFSFFIYFPYLFQRYFRRIKELKTSSNGDSNSYSNSLSNIFTRNEFGHYY